MNILIVGSGAREHAIAKTIQRSPRTKALYCCATSNNPGLTQLTADHWIGDICHIEQVVKQARQWQIDLAIIGPEAPLEKGLADALWENNIPTIGPKKCLAQIETSKAFTRDLLLKYGIPGSPQYRVFHHIEGAQEFFRQFGNNGYVIKADGLAGGKGVKVAGDHLFSFAEAYQFCQELAAQQKTFIIEEKLMGPEFTLLAFSDGYSTVPMPAVQDHKRAFVGNKGPNTGGMGSYSDANHRLPFLSEQDIQAAMNIINLSLQALHTEFDERYIGIIYGSFMATAAGIRLIEFNARFGDPEALNVLALLETDFVEICQAMIHGNLSSLPITFSSLATVCKYAVPEGYPDNPLKDSLIDISSIENTQHLYLAAVNQVSEKLYATGSRTAAVVGVAPTITAAEKIAEQEIKRIRGPLFHREDIGTDALIQASLQAKGDKLCA